MLRMVHHSQNRRLGVPYFDNKGRLEKYIEKPENPHHDMAVPGLYFADETFFEVFCGSDRIKLSVRGEYEIPDAFHWLMVN